MNHPIIANGNGQARYNELLREAEQYRLEHKVAKQRGIAKIINTIVSLFL
jgi:hypothetical protein